MHNVLKFGKVVNDVGFDDSEFRTDEDLEEFVAVFLSKLVVLPFSVRGFPFRHTLVAFEDDAGEHSDIDAVVSELAHKTAVTTIDGIRYGTKITDVIVKRVSVDVIDGEAFGNFAFESKVLKSRKLHATILS